MNFAYITPKLCAVQLQLGIYTDGFSHSPSYMVKVASADTASPTPFSATHSYGASSRPARTGSMRSMETPPGCSSTV